MDAAKAEDHGEPKKMEGGVPRDRGDKSDKEKEAACSPSSSSSDGTEGSLFQIEGDAHSPSSLNCQTPGGSPKNGVHAHSAGPAAKGDTGGTKTDSGTSRPTPGTPPLFPMSPLYEADPNRIPASVFDRKKPSAPTDWSMASNESLFSIQLGENSSFSKDHLVLYGKSGDMGSPSAPLAPLAPTSPARKPSSGAKDEDEDDNGVGLGRSLSHRSDGSTKSFAFPILPGGDRTESIRTSSKPMQAPALHPQPQASSPSDTPKDAEPPAVEPNPTIANAKWFSCFACCS